MGNKRKTAPADTDAPNTNLISRFQHLADVERSRAEAMARIVGETMDLAKAHAHLKAYEDIANQFKQYAAEIQTHGGITSIADAWTRYPVTEAKARDIACAVNSRIDAFIEAHPEWAPAKRTLHDRLSKKLRSKFSSPKFNKLPAKDFQDILDFIGRYDPDPAGYGPLAKALLLRRAELGLISDQAAHLLAAQNGTYKNWELGRHIPKKRNEAGIAIFLQQPLRAVQQLIAGQRHFLLSPDKPGRHKPDLQQRLPGETARLPRAVPRMPLRAGAGPARDPALLHRLRTDAGLSLRGLADLLGTSLDTVWKIEKGRSVRNVARWEHEWLRRLDG